MMNKQAKAKVLEKFLCKALSKCSNATNHVELAKVCNKVYKNLTAIDSALNGNHGHLRLAMADPGYQKMPHPHASKQSSACVRFLKRQEKEPKAKQLHQIIARKAPPSQWHPINC
eukprot:2354655-Ditylum_brightwellii.AAC.1